MPIAIPVLPGDVAGADYRFGATVEGQLRLFDLHWNRWEDRWYVTVLERDETVIFAGCKLALGAYIGHRSAHPLMSLGAFVVVDLGEEATVPPTSPTWLTLGRRHALRWYDAQEIAGFLGYFDG